MGVSAVQTILGYRNTSGINVVGIGLDTPSIDYGPSQNFRSHQEVAEANVYVLENLKNIEVSFVIFVYNIMLCFPF